jgi:hypothetical protein
VDRKSCVAKEKIGDDGRVGIGGRGIQRGRKKRKELAKRKGRG